MRVVRKGYALFVVTAACAALAAPAEAVVPPKSCGTKRIGNNTYLIKADRVTCDFARTWASRYLLRNRRPAGYTCRKYDPRQTRVRFRCYRGSKEFFAIRR